MRNYLPTVVDKIEKRLVELDRDRAWLARQAKVDKSTLTTLLNETTANPSLVTLTKISSALGVDLVAMLTSGENAYISEVPADVRRMLEMFDGDWDTIRQLLSSKQRQITTRKKTTG